MKRILALTALLVTVLMLICSCTQVGDTSSNGSSNTETESSTDAGTTDTGTSSTDSGTGTTDSDTPAGDSDGDGTAAPGDSDNLVDDPNVDDWWTDNKQ